MTQVGFSVGMTKRRSTRSDGRRTLKTSLTEMLSLCTFLSPKPIRYCQFTKTLQLISFFVLCSFFFLSLTSNLASILFLFAFSSSLLIFSSFHFIPKITSSVFFFIYSLLVGEQERDLNANKKKRWKKRRN